MGNYHLPWIKDLYISLYSADSCASETNPKERQKIMTVDTNTDILSFMSHFSIQNMQKFTINGGLPT